MIYTIDFSIIPNPNHPFFIQNKISKEQAINTSNPNCHATTLDNLERAFAGDAMAHLKYLYFAKRAREAGAVDIAEIFERTAQVEAVRAFAHLDLLLPKASTPLTRSLEMAIADETEEFSEIYPKFRQLASQAGDMEAVRDFEAQIEESKQHASDFKKILESNARRLGSLATPVNMAQAGLPKAACRPYLAQWEVQA